MPDLIRQAEAVVRSLKVCFVCQRRRPDTVKISAPHVSWRAATKRVCHECVAGQPWSLKATASPDDPLLQHLAKYAPLFTFLPMHVARCLMGSHKHPARTWKGDYTCLKDWRVTMAVGLKLPGSEASRG